MNPENEPTRLRRVNTPILLRGKKLRSRVFIPSHQPGLAENGMPGTRYLAYHRARARAGVGMQITGATPLERSEVWSSGISLTNFDDAIVPGYQRLSAVVHDEGGLILAQLAHVGAVETFGSSILSASWTHSELSKHVARPASKGELDRIVELYAAAAERCRRGDLDGVEITMAHGMLLASFLSPAMNRRDDEYGGGLDERTLLARRVLTAVRQSCGTDMIVGIRLTADEMIEGGILPPEAARIARRLTEGGVVDYVSVTGGNNTRMLPRVDHWPPTPAPFGTFREATKTIKDAVLVPVAAVGRITDVDLAEEILTAGDADLIGMVRAHIADPDLLAKARDGHARSIRPCVGANFCTNRLIEHKATSCMINPYVGSTEPQPTASEGRSVGVVGGGPGGMEAARRLAIEGWRVTLYEREARLGGQILRWANTQSRREFFKAITWWRDEIARLGIDLRLNTTIGETDLKAAEFDVIVLATGSQPVTKTFGRAECLVNELPPYEAITAPGGRHAVVVDEFGRAGSLLLAEQLSERWERVTLITSSLHPGEGEGILTLYPLVRTLARARIRMIDRARVADIEGHTVRLMGVFDEHRPTVDDVDMLTTFIGSESERTLAPFLEATGTRYIAIGDAELPRSVADAVRDAASFDA